MRVTVNKKAKLSYSDFEKQVGGKFRHLPKGKRERAIKHAYEKATGKKVKEDAKGRSKKDQVDKSASDSPRVNEGTRSGDDRPEHG